MESGREAESVLIRFLHPPTRGSMLSICISVERSWLLTFSNETTCRFQVRFRNFRDSFLMRQHAQPIFSGLGGSTGSSALSAGWLMSRDTSPRVLDCFAVGTADVTRPSLLAPSWITRTRRSRFGSGRPTWLPARHPVCRQSSSNGNWDCRGTKLPSRYFTSFALAWYVPTKTESAASPEKLSRPMKPMWAAALGAKGEGFTTWFSSPVRSRFGSESGIALSTNVRPTVRWACSAHPGARQKRPVAGRIH